MYVSPLTICVCGMIMGTHFAHKKKGGAAIVADTRGRFTLAKESTWRDSLKRRIKETTTSRTEQS